MSGRGPDLVTFDFATAPPPPRGSPPPATALVVLSWSGSPASLARLWAAATFRVAADGGANALHAAFSSPAGAALGGPGAFVPHAVAGDFDSVTPEVAAFYSARGAALARDGGQDDTDLWKSLRAVLAWWVAEGARATAVDGAGEGGDASAGDGGDGDGDGGCGDGRGEGGAEAAGSAGAPAAGALAPAPALGSAARLSVAIAGGTGGRLDHEVQNLNALYVWARAFRRLALVTPACAAVLLRAGASDVRVRPAEEGPTCGLLPLGAPVRALTTRGLEWDVTDWPSALGGRVSSSNAVRGWAPGGEPLTVSVHASEPIVWTVVRHEGRGDEGEARWRTRE